MKKILCFSILGLALTACHCASDSKKCVEDSVVVDSIQIADSLTIDTTVVVD